MLAQTLADAARSGRKPMLCYKRARKPWLAFVPDTSFLPFSTMPSHSLTYKEFRSIHLTKLLELPDNFFFGPETLIDTDNMDMATEGVN